MPPVVRLLLPALLLGAPLLAGTAPAQLIHAEITLYDGEVVSGYFREEREDACGHNLFEAYRDGSPWTEWIDEDALATKRRADYFATHGLLDRLAYVLEGGDRRQRRLSFICRYDALADLERDGETVVVHLQDGSEHRLRESGRDLGNDLVLHADEVLELDWDDVRAVVFTPAAAPPHDPDLAPLWGTVTGSEGTHTGWIQWDRSECLAGDVLDGDEEGRDHEVPMGDIAAIARADARSCRVTLRDGTELLLGGSNDVNEDNRGIVVDVAGLGRVVLPWNRFERLELAPPPAAPPTHVPDYRPLRGTVTTSAGDRHTGRLVIDLEEGWNWEILDGERNGVEYEIPFGNLAGLERDDRDGCTAVLRDGSRLELDGGPDAGPDNHGLLVVTDGGVTTLAWSEVREIAFER